MCDTTVSATVVSVSQVVEHGGVGVHTLHGGHVGHTVVAAIIVGVNKHGAHTRIGSAKRNQNDGTNGNAVLLVERQVVVPCANLVAIDIVLLATVHVWNVVVPNFVLGNELSNHPVAGDVFGVEVNEVLHICAAKACAHALLGGRSEFGW